MDATAVSRALVSPTALIPVGNSTSCAGLCSVEERVLSRRVAAVSSTCRTRQQAAVQRHRATFVLCAASGASPAEAATETESGTLAGTPAVPFLDASSGAPTAFPSTSGVYAVYDKDGVLQYMGLSRRLNASLETHLADLPDLCCSVKFIPVNAPEKSVLVDSWKRWIEEHVAATGSIPKGNESGNATWTTRRARKAVKQEIRLTPGKHVALNVPLTDLIDGVVKENRVVAFIKGTRTAPECGFSHRVLSILNDLKVDYEVLNVLDEDHNPGLRETIKQYSQWPTIPQVYFAGEFLGGADIMDEMAENGQLKELFSK